MEIELSEDLQHYKESFLLGLTVKQTFFSILALGTGTAIVLLLYQRIGVTLSCYVATPFVVPLALTGFYHYHGLTFWQFAGKMVHFAFFNRPLVYWSTESVEELKRISIEAKQGEEKAGKRGADSKMGKDQEDGRQNETGNQRSRLDRAGEHRKKRKKCAETEKVNAKRIEKTIRKPETNKKRKRGKSEAMVTVIRKKNKGLSGVVIKAVGMFFAAAGIFTAGAAMAAVWYGHFR
ncbi:hypothetical protein D3Z62_05270 [Lachnospiraceae bacterium]|nr:PrgI family protein [uncultured Schaedlerella sp.]NBI99566.1 hypothetical protein [Lachnospiraceae bacterium]